MKPCHTILIVDDEPDVVRSVQDLLRLDYKVLGATSAAEGMKILEREEVHAVMTDQRMPEMTGVEFLHKIRGGYPDAVRLLFTGYADIHAVIEAINQGNVYRYITKPWDPDELSSVIREACERYDLLVERKRMLDELREKNDELKHVNEELRKSDELKSAFIQVASHELRTPVTLLAGLSQLAQLMPGSPPTVQDLLQRIGQSSQRLVHLVQEVSTMLSAQRFEQRLERSPTDLAKLITDAADDVRPFVEIRRQSLQMDLPSDLGTIDLDGPKIRDCLNHLLLNAIKFTADEGRITISAARDPGGAARIRIADTGCGIDETCKPRLFEPFFTGFDVSHHSSGHFEHGRKGLGLGLSVVKSFLEMHGGTIEVNSELGKGSTFTLVIPEGHKEKEPSNTDVVAAQ